MKAGSQLLGEKWVRARLNWAGFKGDLQFQQANSWPDRKTQMGAFSYKLVQHKIRERRAELFKLWVSMN